jgi:peptidoglycan/LPS O-acetylase OafA/YrhL
MPASLIVEPPSNEAVSPAEHGASYRADIDGLRGIAVLGVVLFHAFPEWLGSGFIGVDVFFVISGYLITGIIASDLARNRFSYTTFYVRRVRRIFPALALVLIACLAFGWFALFPDEFTSLGQQISGGSAFLANIVLWKQTGYFDTAANLKPLLHLWSLGVEEQFYIVWPTLVALLWRWRNRSTVVLTFLVASFILNVVFITRSPDATFYFPVTRFWELLFGAIIALSTISSPSPVVNGTRRHLLSEAAAWIGMLMLGASFIFLDRASLFPGWWALLPTLGTALLISAGPSTWANRYVFANRVLVAIGLISYPLYLWHWPMLVFQRILQSSSPGVVSRVSIVCASAVLAWLTYSLIERPIRFGRRRTAVVPALCVAIAAVGFGGLLAATGRLAPRSAHGDLQKIWDAAADWSPFGSHYHVVRFKNLGLRALGADAAPHVLFLGDSNIEQFGPRIEQLDVEAPSGHKPVFVAAVGGCPPIPGVRENSHPDCPDFLTNALALAASDRVESVVVGACWICYFRQDRGAEARFNYYVDSPEGRSLYFNEVREADRIALAALQAMLHSLAAMKPTYLLLNIPGSKLVDPKEMIRRSVFGAFTLRAPRLARQSFLDDFGSLRTMLTDVGLKAGARVLDPLDVLCPDAVCPSMTEDGRPLYRDAWHLRPFYVRERALFVDGPLRLQ